MRSSLINLVREDNDSPRVTLEQVRTGTPVSIPWIADASTLLQVSL
jgi:hypothetical protein